MGNNINVSKNKVSGDLIINNHEVIKLDLLERCIEAFSNTDIQSSSFDKSKMMDISDKMDYNNLKLYKTKFTAIADWTLDINRIVNETGNGKIILKVKQLYIDIIITNTDVSSDEILNTLNKKIFTATQFPQEQYEKYKSEIDLIIWYCFSKCQILEKKDNHDN